MPQHLSRPKIGANEEHALQLQRILADDNHNVHRRGLLSKQLNIPAYRHGQPMGDPRLHSCYNYSGLPTHLQ